MLITHGPPFGILDECSNGRDLRSNLEGLCRKAVKKYTRDHNSLIKPKFDKEVTRLKADVKAIIDEYKGHVRKDEGLLKYTVDVPYEDINGTEKIKSHTCNLTYPDNNSLEVYKNLRTDGGNKFDLSSIDNTSLNATLISQAEAEKA
ncbi:MAG: hypothetical protein QF441_09545 [Bacteriovoracaceae bacterium]|nr:hypothetical protein [Bacteriovoracaceae bacterium]